MTTQIIPPEVRAILGEAATKGSAITLNSGTLDRKTYLAVDKVLTALGAKWAKGPKVHLMTDGSNAADVLDDAIVTGQYERIKIDANPLDYYPTSSALVELMIALACPSTDSVILEPSAGEGKIIQGLINYDLGGQIVAYELDPGRNKNLRLRFISNRQVVVADPQDFLTVQQATPVFDSILMNPPFTRGRDTKHILHAYKMLKSGGTLVAIASAGFHYRQDEGTKYLRSLVDAFGEAEDNPPDSFKSSGTLVSTVMIKLVKTA